MVEGPQGHPFFRLKAPLTALAIRAGTADGASSFVFHDPPAFGTGPLERDKAPHLFPMTVGGKAEVGIQPDKDMNFPKIRILFPCLNPAETNFEGNDGAFPVAEQHLRAGRGAKGNLFRPPIFGFSKHLPESR
jgi:hypothetical protein